MQPQSGPRPQEMSGSFKGSDRLRLTVPVKILGFYSFYGAQASRICHYCTI